MPMYAQLAKLTAEGAKNIKYFGDQFERSSKETEAKAGVKVKSAYATLGPYDLMFIIEAPNYEAALKASLFFTSMGIAQIETWTLVPIEHFGKIAAQL
ncbi:MAG: GYD domain-containing protein [Chloroflexota bacterium]|nr:GYD domain-containing protein [Chloroflexota bacterium]